MTFDATEAALQIADGYKKEEMGMLHGPYHAAICELADEVRRLREASAVTAVNFGKAQLEIAQLQTKLARVEDGVRRIVVSLSRRVTPSGHAIERALREMFSVICSELNAALSDPQPSAAPTPKGEPYNGY